MSVYSAQPTVGTTAAAVTVLETDRVGGARWQISNPGMTTIHLGGPGVTTSTGYGLAAGAVVNMPTWPGEVLFAVAAVAGQTLHVLGTGV